MKDEMKRLVECCHYVWSCDWVGLFHCKWDLVLLLNFHNCSVFTMRGSDRCVTSVPLFWRCHCAAWAPPLLRQLLHGMASLDLPYRCPRCGEHKRFRSLSSLRAHLEYNHTYETLYVLSKSNSVCDAAALLPLVAEGALLTPANNNDPFEPLRPSALKERRFPCRELPCADDLSLTPANSNTAARYIPNVEFPLGEIFMKKAMTSTDPGPHGNPSTAVAVAANVAASAVEAAYEEGLARLKARAFERLELDERLEKLSEEVIIILMNMLCCMHSSTNNSIVWLPLNISSFNAHLWLRQTIHADTWPSHLQGTKLFN